MSSSNQPSEVVAAPRRSARLRRLRGSGLFDVQDHPETRHQASLPIRSVETSRVQAAGGDDDVEHDDLCPICQLLLYRPVKTQCNHTLCELCMAHWADVSVTSQMTIVDVDEKPAAFDPVLDLQAKCPMCRTQTSATPDPALAQRLKTKYPQEWAERHAEEEAEKSAQHAGGDSIQTITVYIGNRHKLVEVSDDNSNEHEWTFFVKPSRKDIIQEVRILLHPTFRKNRLTRTKPPYSFQCTGWGTFTIRASVILKPGYSWVSEDAESIPDGADGGAGKPLLPLTWTLDFDGFGGKGSMGRCRLKVKNDRALTD